jgi:hypothetical protein
VALSCASAGAPSQSNTAIRRLHVDLPVDDFLSLLARGEDVTLSMPKSPPHRFMGIDLLRNQEGFRRLAAVEYLLSLNCGITGSTLGNTELARELEVSAILRPSLGELIEASREKLPPPTLRNLEELKPLRDAVLHGAAPLLTKGFVGRIRSIYGDVRRLCTQPIPDELQLAIDHAETVRHTANAWKDPANFRWLGHLLRLVAIERELRNFLRSRGVPIHRLRAINCIHAALEDPLVVAGRLPPGLLRNLKKALILRNLLAHGGLVELNESHQRVLNEAEAGVREVLSAAEFREGGGKAGLGQFDNLGLGLGLAALTLAGGQLAQ